MTDARIKILELQLDEMVGRVARVEEEVRVLRKALTRPRVLETLQLATSDLDPVRAPAVASAEQTRLSVARREALEAARKDGLLKQLEKESGLVSPEGLLYLGFAFTERQGADRDLGGAILKLVAKKFGSKDEGKIAKQKLKTQGIA